MSAGAKEGHRRRLQVWQRVVESMIKTAEALGHGEIVDLLGENSPTRKKSFDLSRDPLPESRRDRRVRL